MAYLEEVVFFLPKRRRQRRCSPDDVPFDPVASLAVAGACALASVGLGRRRMDRIAPDLTTEHVQFRLGLPVSPGPGSSGGRSPAILFDVEAVGQERLAFACLLGFSPAAPAGYVGQNLRFLPGGRIRGSLVAVVASRTRRSRHLRTYEHMALSLTMYQHREQFDTSSLLSRL